LSDRVISVKPASPAFEKLAAGGAADQAVSGNAATVIGLPTVDAMIRATSCGTSGLAIE